MKFQSTEFRKRVTEKRGLMSLRKAAEATGVSASTLSRVEAGKPPDLVTFALLCKWMNVPMGEFFDEFATDEKNDDLKMVLREILAAAVKDRVSHYNYNRIVRKIDAL